MPPSLPRRCEPAWTASSRAARPSARTRRCTTPSRLRSRRLRQESAIRFDIALRTAAEAADKGRDATIEMLARKGRASYLGERSIGHQDPGATSAALLVRAAATTLA